MPSARRMRGLMMVVLAAVITTLFFTSSLRAGLEPDTRTVGDFYRKTMNAMDHRRSGSGSQVVMGGKGQAFDHVKDKDGDGKISKEDEKASQDMASRLRAAEQKAKHAANAKAPLKPDSPSDLVGVGSAAGGQSKDKGKETGSTESAEEKKVTAEMNSILDQAPVVIFSKTSCPYSKRAKEILFKKYSLEPQPYVVELDRHPMGTSLQGWLKKETGRRTVPNIMVNRKTIGGCDEIEDLDKRKTLIDKVKSLGGSQITLMRERFSSSLRKRQL